MVGAENRWDDRVAGDLEECQSLLYRSNLLGSDLAVTNFGGGNTSAKVEVPDPLSGRPTRVMYVKGSGGDLGSMKMDGFATVYLDRVLALEALYRGQTHEDEIAALLPHCAFGLNPRPASIDTAAHAFLPYKHIDHVHPDAVIAIAAAANSRRLTMEAFSGELGWIPWIRPGFELALTMRREIAAQPGLRGLVLAGHGLFTWGETSRECYCTTIEMIGRAAAFVSGRSRAAPFGARIRQPGLAAERKNAAGLLMRAVRAIVGDQCRKVGHFSDSPEILEFVCSERLTELAAVGTSCPDHFLRTKIRPLVIDLDPSVDDFAQRLGAAIDDYRRSYADYYRRHCRAESPAMRDASPVVFLVPGIGMLTFARDKATARIAAEFYGNAVNVMRGASGIDRYVGLDDGEAFAIEYWPLEEAKLRRMPPPRSLAGRIAYITGAASGIGRATAEKFLDEGACVVMSDINDDALEEARDALAARFGTDVVRAYRVDVTDEVAVRESFEFTAREYGGLDIMVASAGIASSAGILETTLAQWQQIFGVLATGYFLASRSAFELMKSLGGSIVFVGSKNSLAASTNAAAYCSAKSSELHLARCLALEGGPHGIRVNVVNPDAVLRGSSIWSGDWRRERAAAYGVDEDDLEDYYARRSILGKPVLPEDIAQAIYFLASDLSSKSTGNIINVDAGNTTAFVR